MIFNAVDKSKPYTVLMVTSPIRLACLSFAGLGRGVYYLQGDFRSKISKVHDRRLVEAGLLTLKFVSDVEKPPEFAENAALVARSTGPTSDPSIPVTVAEIEQLPMVTSKSFMPKPEPTPVIYEPSPAEVTTVVEAGTSAVGEEDPIVVLDDKPKKRRGRKPKSSNAVAQEDPAAKLTQHDQDSSSPDEGVPAAPAENSVSDQGSPALA